MLARRGTLGFFAGTAAVALCCGSALVSAADPGAAATSTPGGIVFSGEDQADLSPDSRPSSASMGSGSFLDSRGSLGGVMGSSGGSGAPPSIPSVDPQQRQRWQDRLKLDDAWSGTGFGADPRQGLSATDFERALGVREFNSSRWGNSGASGTASAVPTVDPLKRDLLNAPIQSGRLDWATANGLTFKPDFDGGRSLDPVLDSLRSGLQAGSVAGIPDRAAVLPEASSGGPSSDEGRNSLRSELFDPLGLTQMNEPQVPRTIRGLMEDAQTVQVRRDNSSFLDQDLTREELNPYLPNKREDFQFGLGDRRLGINPDTGPEASSRASARDLSTARGLGASSLAPALALPMPETRFTTPNRQAGQIQFPSRSF